MISFIARLQKQKMTNDDNDGNDNKVLENNWQLRIGRLLSDVGGARRSIWELVLTSHVICTQPCTHTHTLTVATCV